MMWPRTILLLVGALTSVFAVAACDPADEGARPTPTASTVPGSIPTPTPTHTSESAPLPSTIVVDGDSVNVTTSDGLSLRDIPFTTDPAAAVSQLSDAIGFDATITTLPSGGCFAERQQASWGGLNFIWGDDWQRAPGALFLASAQGSAVTSGVGVTLPSGQSVGATEVSVIAANPSAPLFDNGGWKEIHYDVVEGSASGNLDNYYGAYGLIEEGSLKAFASPIHYFYDC